MKHLSLLALTIILLASACIKTKNIGRGISADKWFKKKEYLNGLKLVPHETTNKKEFQRQYAANKQLWDKALAYLKNTDLKALPVGKYVIEPDKVTVSVTEDSTRNFEKTNWESHKKWIDIQYVISGVENMGIARVTSAKVIKPYDEKRDVANYEVEGKYYISEPGKFFIFFPEDVHRPNITANNNLPDKKIVIKILAVP
jgi:YhcH/YjgK/YiaL family protein